MSEDKINKLEVSMVKLDGSIVLISEIVRRIEDKLDNHTGEKGCPDGCMEVGVKKFAPIEVKEDLTKLKESLEKRQYEWLKYAVTTLVSMLITILVYNKLKF